ncbi:hypothetical protein, partial [Neisseria sp. P0014.S006]|uniref:hypothetical protein n=1 Tax=Neisseria sp. P0014.S006 TaxID=3436752 RepID=UPI003F7D6A64
LYIASLMPQVETASATVPSYEASKNEIGNDLQAWESGNLGAFAYKGLHEATKFGLIHISQRNTRDCSRLADTPCADG